MCEARALDTFMLVAIFQDERSDNFFAEDIHDMEAAEIITWLEALPLWWGLVVIALSAAIEYVFPPFPGDTITLVGAVMIGVAGWPWWAVLLAILIGSMLGICVDWRVGWWLEHTANRDTWLHRIIDHPEIAEAIAHTRQRFERHGVWLILGNRFLPAFRSVFFLVSGMVEIPFVKVLVCGVISVLLWTLALLAVGASVGFHLESLAGWLSRYSMVVWAVVICVGVMWIAKKWIAKRSHE